MRIVVLGGYGNFGVRICRALAGEPGIDLIAAGRTPPSRVQDGSRHPRIQTARLDLASQGFAKALKDLAPELVIHCAGPFQGQDYRVCSAAVAARAHYIDLADGRKFVTEFANRNDDVTRGADRLAISGASSVPALSSAVIDSLVGEFRQVEHIQIAIAPAQRAPRGAATIAAVFSYAGRPFSWLSEGTWKQVWGWQELRRLRFAKLGSRWAAACDVPDLELLPIRYPGVQTVEFRAALELGVEHLALWTAAALRRVGIPLALERWSRPLDRLASFLGPLGTERGGMLVSLKGIRLDGRRARREWHLTADANDGPEIPCMAAILLAKKFAKGEISARGAFPCMGFLTLGEFETEFARWRISSRVEEYEV